MVSEKIVLALQFVASCLMAADYFFDKDERASRDATIRRAVTPIRYRARLAVRRWQKKLGARYPPVFHHRTLRAVGLHSPPLPTGDCLGLLGALLRCCAAARLGVAARGPNRIHCRRDHCPRSSRLRSNMQERQHFWHRILVSPSVLRAQVRQPEVEDRATIQVSYQQPS